MAAHHVSAGHRRAARTGAAAERIHHGYVLVLENATELLRAQKQSAWKEVRAASRTRSRTR
jgi:nitrogen fixation/metabolism regulation signal transduction histidine kinase